MEPTILSKLPASILAEIFSGDHISFLVVSLWQCGDSLLNEKLARNITSIDLKATQRHFHGFLPPMLYSLKSLRSLSLDRGDLMFQVDGIDLIRQILRLDISKLEILKFGSRQLSRYYALNFARPGDPSPSLLDLSVTFPALRSLTLYQHVRSPVVSTLPNLPPNLTYLESPGIGLTLESESVFAPLPRCLETWNTHISISVVGTNANRDSSLIRSKLHRIFHDLPPSLTNISRITTDNIPTSLCFDYLPKTLYIEQSLFELHFLTMEVLRSIPPVTKKIRIMSFSWENRPSTAEWTASLPAHLERLELDPCLITTDLIPLLPRSLKVLFGYGSSLDRLLNWDEVPAHIWPPGLTHLHLPTEAIPNAARKCFPASITRLYCRHDENDFFIPPHLKRFKVFVMHHIKNIEFYPQSNLDEPARAEQHIPGKPNLDSIVLPGDSLQRLNLRFSKSALFHVESDFLPRNLTKLGIGRFSINWFEKLPRTLTTFKCTDLIDIPSSIDSAHPRDYFSTLPPLLKKLTLNGYPDNYDSRPTYPAVSFASLPHLTELECIRIGWFESKVLQHLHSVKKLLLQLPKKTEATEATLPSHPYWTLLYGLETL